MIQTKRARARSFPVLLERFVGELKCPEGGGKTSGRVCTPKNTPCSCIPHPCNLRKVKITQIWRDGVFARRNMWYPGLDLLQLEHQTPPKAASVCPERCRHTEHLALTHLPLRLLFKGLSLCKSRKKYGFYCTPVSKRLCR